MKVRFHVPIADNDNDEFLSFVVFASKINISNLDSETLLLCFQDLRQVNERDNELKCVIEDLSSY